MKKIWIFLIGIVLLMSFTSAVCTVTLSKSTYFPSETVVASMQCSEANEKTQAYTLNWTFNGVKQLELDTGTTPAVGSQIFIQSYTLNSTYAGTINATLTGTNLEGTKGANVTGASINSLVISNIVNSGKWIGTVSSTSATIKDENGKKISGAYCHVHVYNNDQTRVLFTGDAKSIDGEVAFTGVATYVEFQEGIDYIAKVHCYCGLNSTTDACFDEDGVVVTNSIGSADSGFTMNTWLTIIDNMRIAYANGSFANSNDVFYAGYGEKIYWYSNKTNNFNSSITVKSREFLINNATGLNGLSTIQDFSLKVSDQYVTRLHELEIPSFVPTGVYYVRQYIDVYYKNLLVAQYVVKTNEFNITGTADTFKFNNVLMDKTNYYTGSTLQLCANITSSYNTRVEFEIDYRYRCGNSTDVTGQSAIDSFSEIRGINPNTNQVRCANMIIPFHNTLLYKTSECQGIVTIKSDYINTFDNKITLQGTNFNITDFGMYPIYHKDPEYPMIKFYPDWRRFDKLVDGVSKNYYQAKVNMTQLNENYLDPNNRIVDNAWDVYFGFSNDMPKCEGISNYSVEYLNGSKIENTIENKEMQRIDVDLGYHSRCAIGIENVNFSDVNDDYFVIKVWFEDFNERNTNSLESMNTSLYNSTNQLSRSAKALEGIENKTGTFKLSIDCPESANVRETMTCIILAQVEDDQQVQKEVDFTCYIKDGDKKLSSLNFNQMVNKTQIALNKDFLIPELALGNEYVLQCEASYYNLGSRTDMFYDTFIATERGTISSGVSQLQTISETETGELPPEKKDYWYLYCLGVAFAVLCFLAIIFIILKKSRENS